MNRATILSATMCATALCTPAKAAECQKTPYVFGPGGVTSARTTWRMAKDTTCDQILHHPNWQGWVILDKGTKIVRQPAHGVAGIESSIIARRYAYQPNRGFVGKDSFVISATFQKPNGVAMRPAPLTITVDVEVVPAL
jgi:hypothetical protein